MEFKTYSDSNGQEQTPVSLGLIDLFAYSSKSKHAIDKIKIIYNLEKETCLVDAKLSDRNKMTEISSTLMNQIDYLVNSLIKNYVMIYDRTFLSKIIFESKLDELGVIYDSIKLSCVMKSNIPNLPIQYWDIIHQAMLATVNAEKAEVVERPATSLILSLKRKKLRKFIIVYDYGIDDMYENTYEKPFSASFLASLKVLLDDYCKYSGTHEASVTLTFDLMQRESLRFIEGSLYPSYKLKTYNDRFSPQEAKFLLVQINQIFQWLDSAIISGLILTRHSNGHFVCQFKVSGVVGGNTKEQPKTLDVSLTAANNLANTLTEIVQMYSVPNFYKDWRNQIEVNLLNRGANWLVDFQDYELIGSFKNEKSSMEATKAHLIKVTNELIGVAKIKSFCLVAKGSELNEVKLKIVDFSKNDDANNNFKPMGSTSLDVFISKKSKLYFNFTLGKEGYYLTSERYLGWSEL